MKEKMTSILRSFAFILLPLSVAFAHPAVYYVDPAHGNDHHSGTSTNSAWKTLDMLNTMTFEPGDQIYLKRGQTFDGYLHLKGSGAEGHPVRLGAYGTGRRPVIRAASHTYAIRLADVQYWEIADVETSGGERAGIFIGCTRDSLVLNHFRITNCYVHHVGNDSIYDWKYNTLTGGIVIANGEIAAGKDRFSYHAIINDAIIDGCTVRYIKRWNCIAITSGIVDGVKGNAHHIRNCTVEYSVADGIRMTGVQNSFIENSTMYKNGAWPKSPNPDWGGLGAWFFNADNCTIQFCEASYIDNWHMDGGAFDIDYNQTNSTVQYCYGHDCHGYGVSVFGADATYPTVNSVVRYNIFSNNARDSVYAYQGDIYIFTWNGGLLDGVKVYNNTSYWNPAADAPALKFDADFTGSNPNIFKNNIIYADHPWLDSLKNDALQCDHNMYWVIHGKPVWQIGNNRYHSLSDWQKATGLDGHSQYTDPLLQDPAYHGRGMPSTQFQLKPGSPAIDAGVDVGNMGDIDFLRNPVPGRGGNYDMGACEFGVTQGDKKASDNDQ